MITCGLDDEEKRFHLSTICALTFCFLEHPMYYVSG